MQGRASGTRGGHEGQPHPYLLGRAGAIRGRLCGGTSSSARAPIASPACCFSSRVPLLLGVLACFLLALSVRFFFLFIFCFSECSRLSTCWSSTCRARVQDDSFTRWFLLKEGELAYDPLTQNYFALRVIADSSTWRFCCLALRARVVCVVLSLCFRALVKSVPLCWSPCRSLSLFVALCPSLSLADGSWLTAHCSCVLLCCAGLEEAVAAAEKTLQ